MLRREQRFKTSEHEFRWLALLPLASLSPCGTLLGCWKLTQNVLRIKMCHNTRGPMIGWSWGWLILPSVTLTRAFPSPYFAFSECRLGPHATSLLMTVWLLLHQVSCPAGEEGHLVRVLFFKERKQAPGTPQYIFIHACWLDWITNPLLNQPLKKGLGVPELA